MIFNYVSIFYIKETNLLFIFLCYYCFSHLTNIPYPFFIPLIFSLLFTFLSISTLDLNFGDFYLLNVVANIAQEFCFY